MVKDVRHFYFGYNDVIDETLEMYVEMMSDIFFVYNTRNLVAMHGEKSKKNTFFMR